jgi:hypothetical protein|tara:strand:- start:142 stop:315 length:174 start_codon:yes stop_codon:yes gene_type:complete
MRNKILITNKLEKIDNELSKLNFFIKSREQNEALNTLQHVKNILANIGTLLNTETQD